MEVPYWWDRTLERLAATIHKARQDIVPNPPDVDPIPSSCPTVPKPEDSVPISHGIPWDGFQDLTGW